MRRWIDLILYACFGTVLVVLVLQPLLQPIGRAWGAHTSNMPSWLFVGLVIILGMVGLAGLSPLRTSRPVHFLQWRYPSWIWAVIMGIIGSGAVLHFAGDYPPDAPVHAGDWLLLAVVMLGSLTAGAMLTQWFTHKPADDTNDSTTTTGHDQLTAWINAPETPITKPEQDLFGFASTTAQRIARHLLYETYCPCIGLTGPFGSGKTGILNLVESYLKRPLNDPLMGPGLSRPPRCVWVARVGSWGQTSGSSAAQQVLEGALDELANHVDCLTLCNLSRQYQAALQATKNTWLGILGALGTSATNPEDTLQRFDPILIAMDAHLVLFIEDLDRNQSNPALFGEVQALLDRLKQNTKRIRFVIVVGNDAARHIDFAKLCDRYEMLSSLAAETTERIVGSVVKELRATYPDDFAWPTSDEEEEKEEEKERSRFQMPDAVTALLSQPRSLHQTLCHVRQAWSNLHGEVDLMELLLVSALRASSSSAFEFLATHVTDLRGYFSPVDADIKEHGKSLKQMWDVAMNGVAPREKVASEAVLDILFPGWMQGQVVEVDSSPQSIRHGPHAGMQLFTPAVDYWQRLFAEEIIGRPDQEVARVIHAWLKQPEQGQLPQLLVNEQGYAMHFERLLPSTNQQAHPLYVDRERLRRLTEQVYELLLMRDGVSANGDIEASVVLLRIASERATLSDHIDWVEALIDKALQNSLRFALYVEHRWTQARFGVAIQSEARRRMLAKVRSTIEVNGMESLISILDPAESFLLNQLIRHQYNDAVWTPSDWQWLVPKLLEEAERRPSIFVPQLAMLITRTTHQSEEDKESGLPRTMLQVEKLDEDYLRKLFFTEEQRTTLMELVAAERSYPNLGPDRMTKMRQMQEIATQWLKANPST